MLFWRNEGRFQVDEYGDKRIQKESVISHMMFDTQAPNWINF